jgi:hypothetical protein
VRDDVAVRVGDAYLTELGTPADEWDHEAVAGLLASLHETPAAVHDEELLRGAAHPVIGSVIKLFAGVLPGADATEDAEWAADVALRRRQVTVYRKAGVDAGLAALNLQLLDWIDARIASRDETDFAALVRANVDGLLDACRRGRERGDRLREQRGPEGVEERWSLSQSIGWSLRHPVDHYFRCARAVSSDDQLCQILDAQIELLAESYDRLAAQPADHNQAELVVELEVLGPVDHGWAKPVTTTILAVESGGVSVGDLIGLRLVADPSALFNGTLISVRAGERWRTYAHRLADGTVVPHDGTRRIAA